MDCVAVVVAAAAAGCLVPGLQVPPLHRKMMAPPSVQGLQHDGLLRQGDWNTVRIGQSVVGPEYMLQHSGSRSSLHCWHMSEVGWILHQFQDSHTCRLEPQFGQLSEHLT